MPALLSASVFVRLCPRTNRSSTKRPHGKSPCCFSFDCFLNANSASLGSGEHTDGLLSPQEGRGGEVSFSDVASGCSQSCWIIVGRITSP